MLINFVRLGMMDEAKKLSESLNGYLNIYKKKHDDVTKSY